MSAEDFVRKTTEKGFGGSNIDINNRLGNTFNQWTRSHDDQCAYVNEQRILQKPMKYYTADFWAPHPNEQHRGDYGQYSIYTPIGNQKAYGNSGNLTYPGIGEPTSMGNRRQLLFTQPLRTTPFLGSNATNAAHIDIESTHLGFGIGQPTNLNDSTRYSTTSVDWDRWHLVDPNVVQNPKNIIFADGAIPVGGISSRNELRNFTQMTPH